MKSHRVSLSLPDFLKKVIFMYKAFRQICEDKREKDYSLFPVSVHKHKRDNPVRKLLGTFDF